VREIPVPREKFPTIAESSGVTLRRMAISRARAARERAGIGEDLDPEPAAEPRPSRPLTERPLVRAGVLAWSVAGLALIAAGVLFLLSRMTVVIVPLVLAVFPAAVLVLPTTALKRRGVPPALAALLVLVGAIGVLSALFATLAPSVAGQLAGLATELEEGYTEVRRFLAFGPLGIETLPFDQVVESFRAQAVENSSNVTSRLLEAGILVVEGFAGLALGLFALFFYLKDGGRIAAWIRDLFPARLRADVHGIGDRVWFTIGAYIRGLLIIGLVDAIAIGTGLLALRIPLALPLAVLVFFGALFPIIGAFTAGTVAVLVALATNGIGAAVAVLVLIVVVQQVEGHVLTPVLLGRATEMHPLAVITALGAGAVLMGVLGAFLAVPVAASIARALAFLRTRRGEPAPAPI
jgi:putative heme transporter